jgi:hypothetical protein
MFTPARRPRRDTPTNWRRSLPLGVAECDAQIQVICAHPRVKADRLPDSSVLSALSANVTRTESPFGGLSRGSFIHEPAP